VKRPTVFATSKPSTRALLLVCAVTPLVAAPPTAAHAQVPPEPVATCASSEVGVAAQIATLIQESRETSNIAIRRQIHNELTLIRLDQRWGDC
jgi:hypothetical protein